MSLLEFSSKKYSSTKTKYKIELIQPSLKKLKIHLIN